MSAQSAIFNPSQTTSAATGDGFSVPRLTTTGRLAIAFGTGDSGMMVYDTTLNNLFIWTGSAWESVPASGDAGVNGAVQYNDNGVVSGATNFVYNKVNQKVGIGTITPNVELDVVGNATITGDLTVDTSTLKVDSANNRVGVGTASPANQLSVRNEGASGIAVIDVRGGSAGAGAVQISGNATTLGTTSFDLLQNSSGAFVNQRDANPLSMFVNGSERYAISSSGVATWSNVGGVAGTAMTLNATGLGVGTSPLYKLHAVVTSGAVGAFRASTAAIARLLVGNTVEDVELKVNANGDGQLTAGASKYLGLGSGGLNDRVILDTAGQVGIGLTPSASHILSCAGPIGISGTNSGTRTSYISNSGACSIYYTDGGGSGFFADFGNLIIQPRTSAARSVVIATGSTTPVERAVVKSTGQVRFVPLASDPAGAEAGDVYYNSTSNKLKCYNGTTWNDLF